MESNRYQLVQTSHGSYLALAEELNRPSNTFWSQVRSSIAAVIALPLTMSSYIK